MAINDFGAAPQLCWLPVDRFVVDESYQRSISGRSSQELISRIAINFRWSAFQAVLAALAEAAGFYSLIDGQHRVEAAKRRDIPMVPTVIIEALSAEEQAQSFISANSARIPVDQFSLHRARLRAGDADARAIESLVASVQIKIPRSQPSHQMLSAGMVLCVSTFGQLLKRFPNEAADAVGAVADAYRSEIGGLRAPFFMASAHLLSQGTARPALTAALRRSSSAALFSEMKRDKSGRRQVDAAIAVIRARLTAGPVLKGAAFSPRLSPPTQVPAAATALRQAAAAPERMAAHSAPEDPVAKYIREKGVTRCPPAFSAPSVQGERAVASGTLSILERNPETKKLRRV
jgi:ParB/Sulfiredoxin domain